MKHFLSSQAFFEGTTGLRFSNKNVEKGQFSFGKPSENLPFHPFSSLFFLKKKKGQKKAEKG